MFFRVKEIRPDTGSPRVMRRKSTENISANKNVSGTGVSPSYFHHSNILCTSTPIRRQCSDYNPSTDTAATTFPDPNESPIQGHRMPRKVSSKFNILPDKITVSKCIPTSENLPTARQMEGGLLLETDFDNYQAEVCSEMKMDNIQLSEGDEPLTSDFNYDLNDLNKSKKDDGELSSETRLVQCEGGAYLSPPRISPCDVKTQYGSSMPSFEHLSRQKSRTPLTRVRNHSDPGLMPSALANPKDDCKIKRQLSSDVMPSHYDQPEEHSSNSTDSEYPVGSPENILRFPSSQNHVAGHFPNQRVTVDTELKTIFPLPPSPLYIKPIPAENARCTATKREQMHIRDIWEKGFTKVTEPHINVSHAESKSPNCVLPRHHSTPLPNKPHRSTIPEEKKHFKKIFRDYSRKDEALAAGNSPTTATTSVTAPTMMTVVNSSDPTVATSMSSFSQSQLMTGTYINKLTVAEELLSSLRESALGVPSNQEKISLREASTDDFDSRKTLLEIENVSSPDSKHHHLESLHSPSTITNSTNDRKEAKETDMTLAAACPHSPEPLPDLCVSDIAAMKQSLFQFLQKMSSISTKVTDNNNSQPSSHESSMEGAVYPPNDSFEVEPFLHNTNRTTNPEVISNHSPSLLSHREAISQVNNTPEIIDQTPVNVWAPSSPKTGFFPIDPQPLHNMPSPTLAKSLHPRHVVYPVPFLPSGMSVSENQQGVLSSKEVW